MTSANVVRYNIYDDTGKLYTTHRQNIMCKIDTRNLLEIKNPETYTIKAWGYDEEEEIWENKPVKLNSWLKKNKNEII